MVAYKNNPDKDKDYQKQGYQLSNSATDIQYDPFHNRLIPASSSIDEIVQQSPTNELYQKSVEPCNRTNNYDLSQPTWFEEIMKKLTNDNAKKSEKETTQNNLHYGSLN